MRGEKKWSGFLYTLFCFLCANFLNITNENMFRGLIMIRSIEANFVLVNGNKWIICLNYEIEDNLPIVPMPIKIHFIYHMILFCILKSCILNLFIFLDGWATDDLVYQWKEIDPVQIVPGLHLPRFTLEQYKSAYCNVITNTGKYTLSF